MRILLTEDDSDLAAAVASGLNKDGFVVDTALTGCQAQEYLADSSVYDAVVLDLNLPDMDGLSLLSEIKAMANLPVMALTGRDAAVDRVRGLKKGLDDYLTKPFALSELAARLRVLSRLNKASDSRFQSGGLKICFTRHQVVFNDQRIPLSGTEFRLLHYLARRPKQAVTCRELLAKVWDRNSNFSAAKVVTAVSRLRAKLGASGDKLVRTCPGGYSLNAD